MVWSHNVVLPNKVSYTNNRNNKVIFSNREQKVELEAHACYDDSDRSESRSDHLYKV